MGTSFSVRSFPPEPFTAEQRQVLQQQIESTLERVNGAMTTYADSEVTRFNASQDEGPFELSRDTVTVLDHSLRVGAQSDGALDITIGPLVRAFGFGPDEARDVSTEEVDKLREHLGQHLLTLEGSLLYKKNPRVEIDLSAVAKGYAVDQVMALLLSAGLENSLVEVGGELRASGLKPGGVRWHVGIEAPDGYRGGVHRSLPLDNLSIATSGDYRNYREVDGNRVSHIFDPRTARTVSHRTASVTVLAESCAEADAQATALMVLGESEGLRLAESLDWAALFLVRLADGTFAETTTAAFDRLLESSTASSS